MYDGYSHALKRLNIPFLFDSAAKDQLLFL
jgi:hypothetical protein